MKKVLAVMLALVMAFSLCVPSFAEGPADDNGGFNFDAIVSAISGVLGQFLPTDAEGNISAEDIMGIIGGIIGGGETPDNPNDPSASELPERIENLTPAQAEILVRIALQEGATPEQIREVVTELYNNDKMDEVSYNNILAALDNAENPSNPGTSLPNISDEDVAEAAAAVINTLKRMGVPEDQMKSVVDELFNNGTIPQNVYDEIIRQLDEEESTTESSNGDGGIGGFLGGIVDAIKNLFGGGEGGGEGEGTTTPTNPDSYEGKEPTGDTAILSVVAVAAVAGAALVLTKKKQK